MVAVSVKWVTPDAESMIVDIARVSGDPSKPQRHAEDLIRYLIRNKHWSPFEMASVCVEITGSSRAITRQLLRHWTLRPQEFSQRYQDINVMREDCILTDARMQHPTNRQSSMQCDDEELAGWWMETQINLWNHAIDAYESALERGIAKEVARVVLPEGMTPTRLFVAGTVRDWLHYCQLRRGNGTQLEHQHLAQEVWAILETHLPCVTQAWESEYVDVS